MDDHGRKIDDAEFDAHLSRRQWLLSLGSAIVLAGTNGLPSQAGSGIEQTNVAGSITTLPPGLYLPSFDHLTHVLTRDEAIVKIPPGAETEYVRPREAPYRPKFFSPENLQTIRRLVEIILGEDLKGSEAKSAQDTTLSIYDEVAEWIDLEAASAPEVRRLAQALPMEERSLAVAYFGSEEPVRRLETFEPESILRDGLDWLEATSRQRFNKGFLQLTSEQQFRLVKSISDEIREKSSLNAGSQLFAFLKQETIRGFYTSRLGLDELSFKGNAFYPESPTCDLTPHPNPKQAKPE